MEKKINYKRILDKLECVSRITTHQKKRIMNETKTKKIEILNDAVIVIERYLDEIKMEIKKSKGCTAVPDNDKMPKSNYFIQNDDIRNWLYNKAEREMKIK